MSSSFSKESP